MPELTALAVNTTDLPPPEMTPAHVLVTPVDTEVHVIAGADTTTVCAAAVPVRAGVELSVARGVKLNVPATSGDPLNVMTLPDADALIQPGIAPVLTSIVTGAT